MTKPNPESPSKRQSRPEPQTQPESQPLPQPAPATDRRIRAPADLDALRFSSTADGSESGGPLIPVITQDADSGQVLMLAWANREALERTLASGEMHFWSRSRGELWHKGATSGNTQRVRSLHADCDGDTVLARVEPAGPACHTGETTCFGDTGGHWLDELWATLESRARERPEGSYTTRLLDDENLRLKKLGEETAELIHALAKADGERIPEESGDLLYHMLVALLASGHSIDDLARVLKQRR